MFRDYSLMYITDIVLKTAKSVDDAFSRMKNHFMTPGQKVTYKTEWNTISSHEILQKNSDKTKCQVLGILFQRARDFQSILDDSHQ